jgi:ATP-dependent Lon protease
VKQLLKEVYPVLPLRNLVMFPRMVVPLFVGRNKSLQALEAAGGGGQILLVAQKDPNKEDPKISDLYKIGLIGQVTQILRLQDGTIKALVEGVDRVTLVKPDNGEGYIYASVKPLLDLAYDANNNELKALRKAIVEQFDQYVQLNKKVPADAASNLLQIDDFARFSDSISSHLMIKTEKKQEILECVDMHIKMEKILTNLELEIEMLNTESRIRGRVRNQIEKNQKDYYLNEQLKAIHKELGEEDFKEEVANLAAKIKKLKLPKEARDKAESELRKLKTTNPMSSESSVIRNYLDWIIDLPWSVLSPTKKDLAKAEELLNKHHYGLEKVKERIVEYLAVNIRTGDLKSPIICFVGPPGVGKTSLAKSIAEAVGRKFAKVSLGGLRDEAEIKGHRRTYVGALPGKILQSMKKVKFSNPVILLDEIDKLSFDYRGDPASALLEVLDPEQNNIFSDHYLEVDYDLSKVMFIATANSLKMPRPLMDRMEIIHLSGYTEEEKLSITENYLIPRQFKSHGIKQGELIIESEAIMNAIRKYTFEAGVRSLEREISKIARKTVKEIIMGQTKSVTINNDNLEKYLGIPKYINNPIDNHDLVGITNGLAYNQAGGSLLAIEVVIVHGKGEIKITGKLGEVMKESVQAAYSFIRSRCTEFGINPMIFKRRDIHVHVPEGATPKDGPSAGIAMCTSIISALTNIPVHRTVAMTGEITLRGRVLAIGGLKEKLLSALRSGVKKAIIPKENIKDLADLPQTLLNSLEIVPVEMYNEVVAHALTQPIKPIPWEDKWDLIEPDVDNLVVNNNTH